MRTAIIGAGAAGCFCAIELKRRRPEAVVDVYEAGSKPLAKVAITGGGRCNLTNSFAGINSLKEAYPRGDKLLKKVFSVFDNKDTWKWFENEGVNLVLQDDQCVFPASQDAMQIVNLLKSRMRQLGVNLRVNSKVSSAKTLLDQYDSVVVTTGGYHKPVASGSAGDLFEGLDLEIVPPVPSLFTFNLPYSPVRDLMGTVVENVSTSLAGTKFKASGPLLITHWVILCGALPCREKVRGDTACQLVRRRWPGPCAHGHAKSGGKESTKTGSEFPPRTHSRQALGLSGHKKQDKGRRPVGGDRIQGTEPSLRDPDQRLLSHQGPEPLQRRIRDMRWGRPERNKQQNAGKHKVSRPLFRRRST